MGASALMLGAHTIPELITSPVTTDAIEYVVKPTLDELQFISPRLTEAARGATQGVTQFGNRVMTGLGNTATNATNAVRTVGNNIKTFGRNFVDGILPQMSSSTPAVNYTNLGAEFIAPFRNGGLLENSRNILKNRK